MRLPTSPRAAGLNRQRGIWRSALEAASEGVLLRISRDLLAARVVNVDRQRQANRLMQMCNDPAARRAWRTELTDSTRLLVSLSAALGFSPAARERIKTGRPAKNPIRTICGRS
jgi:hypothetical protein